MEPSGNRYAIQQTLDELYRSDSRRIFASLVRLLRDFDRAEEAMHEAFAIALERWEVEGIPAAPRSWLVSAGRFKAIDAMRRRGRFDELKPDVAARFEEIAVANSNKASDEIEDDRLRLIFTCCHPAIDPKVQIPLTLREVCGLTTEQIASAFLTSTTTMAQRLVRGKAKIRDAGIPFEIPKETEFRERLDSILVTIYLVFNEGYSASSGDALTQAELSSEAIRLGRLLCELLPDPEVSGLLAMMLLQESRRRARSSASGDIVLLDDQDRSLWDSDLISEGLQRVQNSLASGHYGKYTLQAAIAAVHARAVSSRETNWRQIVSLYDSLLLLHATPVVELNRAVAIAMRDGPAAGLELIDAILARGDLQEYHLAHAARADLCRRLNRIAEAKAAYHVAIALARQEPEQRFLRNRLTGLEQL